MYPVISLNCHHLHRLHHLHCYCMRAHLHTHTSTHTRQCAGRSHPLSQPLSQPLSMPFVAERLVHGETWARRARVGSRGGVGKDMGGAARGESGTVEERVDQDEFRSPGALCGAPLCLVCGRSRKAGQACLDSKQCVSLSLSVSLPGSVSVLVSVFVERALSGSRKRSCRPAAPRGLERFNASL